MSTERQEQQGTIASQLDALARWAREQDHDVVDAYICVDDGYSGSRLDRPGLDRLRDGAEAGAFEAALVLCPDRLARKYAYQILILEELERFGVQVIFLDQPLSDDPQARLLTQIQGAVAEYERIKIAVIESDSPICFHYVIFAEGVLTLIFKPQPPIRKLRFIETILRVTPVGVVPSRNELIVTSNDRQPPGRKHVAPPATYHLAI